MTKKFKVIAKVNSDKFVKYHVNDLIRFTKFLDKEYAGWRWYNVYDTITEKEIANFTNKNRPTKKYV